MEYVHRFTRAISVGNPREFLQAEKEDQEMAEAWKRLIKKLHHLLELSPTCRKSWNRSRMP